jgi:hypothetical protein
MSPQTRDFLSQIVSATAESAHIINSAAAFQEIELTLRKIGAITTQGLSIEDVKNIIIGAASKETLAGPQAGELLYSQRSHLEASKAALHSLRLHMGGKVPIHELKPNADGWQVILDRVSDLVNRNTNNEQALDEVDAVLKSAGIAVDCLGTVAAVKELVEARAKAEHGREALIERLRITLAGYSKPRATVDNNIEDVERLVSEHLTRFNQERENFAAGYNRSDLDFALAISDLLQGEYERIKEFGVRITKADDPAKLNVVYRTASLRTAALPSESSAVKALAEIRDTLQAQGYKLTESQKHVPSSLVERVVGVIKKEARIDSEQMHSAIALRGDLIALLNRYGETEMSNMSGLLPAVHRALDYRNEVNKALLAAVGCLGTQLAQPHARQVARID